MSGVPRYAVFRAHPDLPAGFLPPEYEGRWINLDDVPRFFPAGQVGQAVAVFKGKFERREDGATAKVFEIRP